MNDQDNFYRAKPNRVKSQFLAEIPNRDRAETTEPRPKLYVMSLLLPVIKNYLKVAYLHLKPLLMVLASLSDSKIGCAIAVTQIV